MGRPGRTDAGVHALEQVAHLDIITAIPAETLRRRINDALPSEFHLLKVELASTQVSRAARRGVEKLSVRNLEAAHGLREAFRLVGPGRPRPREDARGGGRVFGDEGFSIVHRRRC